MNRLCSVFIVATLSSLALAQQGPTDCRMMGCGIGGQCVENALGTFRCECSPGFEYDRQIFMCKDIDECAIMGTALCMNGRCRNVVGTWTCDCFPGFRPGMPNGQICIRLPPRPGMGGPGMGGPGMGGPGMGGPGMGLMPSWNDIIRCRTMQKIYEF